MVTCHGAGVAAFGGADELDARRSAAGRCAPHSSGYHAVDFLLWGQALEEVGPGQAPLD